MLPPNVSAVGVQHRRTRLFWHHRYGVRKIYFRAKRGAKDIQKGTARLIRSYQFAPSCRQRTPQQAALHL